MCYSLSLSLSYISYSLLNYNSNCPKPQKGECIKNVAFTCWITTTFALKEHFMPWVLHVSLLFDLKSSNNIHQNITLILEEDKMKFGLWVPMICL